MHPANCFPTPGFDLDHCRQLMQRQGTGTFSVEFTVELTPQYGGDGIRSGSSCLAQFSSTLSPTLHPHITLQNMLHEALSFVKTLV